MMKMIINNKMKKNPLMIIPKKKALVLIHDQL